MNPSIIIEHIVAGFLCLDADWIIRRANTRAVTLLRRPVEQLIGKTLWDVFPGLEGTPAAAQVKATPTGRVERRGEFFSPPLYNWFELWSAPGDEKDVYLFFRDVSDRERAIQSEAMRESLRRVLMDAPIAISITRGAEHRYELTNHASRALMGGRVLEGLTARNALPEVDPALFDTLDRVYRDGQTVTVNDLSVTYDRYGNGAMYTGTFDVTYQPMRDSDGCVSGIMQTAVETTAYAGRRAGVSTE